MAKDVVINVDVDRLTCGDLELVDKAIEGTLTGKQERELLRRVVVNFGDIPLRQYSATFRLVWDAIMATMREQPSTDGHPN